MQGYILTAIVALLAGFAGGYALCLNRLKLRARATKPVRDAAQRIAGEINEHFR